MARVCRVFQRRRFEWSTSPRPCSILASRSIVSRARPFASTASRALLLTAFDSETRLVDVALEALTVAWRSKRLKLDELNRIAKKLRVLRVMQPYLETVVL